MTQLIIVTSYLNPKIRWNLIDRILLVSEMEKIKTYIIVNKYELISRVK